MELTPLSPDLWPGFQYINRALQCLLIWAIWHSFRSYRLQAAIPRSTAVAVGLLSLLVLSRTPYSAGELEVSDAVQYAIGAQSFANTGTFAIDVEGTTYPPRYPPWFSTIILEPFYQIPGADIGIGILPITILGILGVVAAFRVGARNYGLAAGVLAAVAIALTPEYRHMTRIIWSDGPTAAFSLILLMLFCSTMERRSISTADCLAVAVFGGIAGLFRFTGVGLLVPFLIPIVKFRAGAARLTGLAILGLGWLMATVLTCVYNQTVFGDPFRSGYHVWVSVPYDFPELLFNLRYIPDSISALVELSSLPGVLFFHLLLGLPAIQRVLTKDVATVPPLNRDLLLYSLSMSFALLPIFLPYFYFRERFLLPIIAPLVVMLGIRAATLLVPNGTVGRRFQAILLAMLLGSLILRPLMFAPPERRMMAERILQQTPSDSIIVTTIDPILLSKLLNDGGTRQILPLSRSVEFASKAYTPIAPGQINPPPTSAGEHLAPGLFTRGSILPIRKTALDHPEILDKALADGRPIFLESWNGEPSELDRLRSRFVVRAVDQHLYEISGTRSQ